MKKTFTQFLLVLGIASAVPSAMQAQQLYSNGNFSTGTTTKSGVTAPAGYTWSEAQNNTGNTTESNTNSGYTASKLSAISLADDFTVPAGQSWTITDLSFFGYQTGAASTPSPFTELSIRIWRGSPAVAGSTVVFGDLTTNRLAGATDARSYRIFNTLYPTPSAPGTTRKIWKVRATVSPALVLPAGTYWVEWASTVTGGGAHFYVPVTIAGTRQTPGANALQYISGAWTPTIDAGNPDSAPDVTVDFPFIINDGTILASGLKKNAVELKVGPVPTSGTVNAEFETLRSAAIIELSDMQGRQVWKGNVKSGSSSATVPMDNLAAGVYMFTMTSAQGSSRARLVKE
ncbi:T9SS type A sorting domain-containing protein [Hymenobacter sp. GOD-10R]|uniref:T9SS type A sorting domain-containing protein n=1 Tax=Hymenobacter sp. GOD-10R TaxID=3093922 RepID=UPI002D76E4BA|nr:T9SS type A sorting domain-containing protein [Hymenobacter sp. GOD-10R]WRQ27771.1 T9SS type A sorting domain-containing protein [Hymenobacter sp. GOD-10R]